MASLSTNKTNGRRKIQFVLDEKRHTIRLGKVTKKQGQTAKRHVEALIAAKITGHAANDDTSRWVAELPNSTRGKLVTAGLLQPAECDRHAEPAKLLGAFTAEYLATRKNDCEDSTVRKMRSSLNQLLGFLGNDRPLTEIEPADAYRYQLDRRKTCAQASVSKDVKIAKTAFKHAKMLGYVEDNPFKDITAGTDENPENAHYVEVADFEKILDACPNSTWRVIVTLGRIGGLRTPSEFRHLCWRDVKLAEDRMLVMAPKTKKQRRLRIFPRLKRELEEHLERTGETSEFVIDVAHYRDAGANLRTQLGRIIADAGIPAFPRFFDNFRASASTDLAMLYPIKQAADWLGHSTQTALKYYHMSRDRDFTATELETVRQCFGDLISNATQKATQQVSATGCTEPQVEKRGLQEQAEKQGICNVLQQSAEPCEAGRVTPTGLEPVLPP